MCKCNWLNSSSRHNRCLYEMWNELDRYVLYEFPQIIRLKWMGCLDFKWKLCRLFPRVKQNDLWTYCSENDLGIESRNMCSTYFLNVQRANADTDILVLLLFLSAHSDLFPSHLYVSTLSSLFALFDSLSNIFAKNSVNFFLNSPSLNYTCLVSYIRNIGAQTKHRVLQ